MMKVSFKKSIALFNTIAVAITVAIVFVVIYLVARFSSFRHLDNEIRRAKIEILNSGHWENDITNNIFNSEGEAKGKVEVNPTFIQMVDEKDNLLFKSSNLKGNQLRYYPQKHSEYFYNMRLDGQRLRVGQFPVKNNNGKIFAYLILGISQQGSYYVLSNLLFTLSVIFPLVLLVMYVVIYVSASKAIAPVHRLIITASGISDSNIDTRLPLPAKEDELFQLATTINKLLDRIENSIKLQKQFTADASHEIKNPIAALKGNLEMLLRKKREPEELEAKIKEAIRQTNLLHQLVEQLLQLARTESRSVKKEIVSLYLLATEAAKKWEKQLAENDVNLRISLPRNSSVLADHFLLTIIVDNLFSNAIKYGTSNGEIAIDWDERNKVLSISNQGNVIDKEQIPLLFNRFYRTDNSRNSKISGSGLGLAIVKQLADLQHIKLSVESLDGTTTFHLHFTGSS